MKKSKLVLITGGTSQIAQAVCKKLNVGSTEFIIQLRNEDQFTPSKQSNIVIKVADLGTQSGIDEFVNYLDKNFSKIDIWINCLGEINSAHESFESLSEDKLNSMINVNFSSVIKIMKIIITKMGGSSPAHIVMLNSLSAKELFRNNSVYAASKAGLAHFINSLSVDYLAKNIKFTNLYLGLTNTSLIQKRFGKNAIDGKLILQVDDVADSIVWILNQPANINIREIMITPNGQVGPFTDLSNGTNE